MSSLGNKISKKKVIFLDLDDTLCETEGITPQRLEMAKQALSETINSTLLDSVMEQAISWDPVQSTTGTKGRLQRIKKELKLPDESFDQMRAIYNEALFNYLTLYDGVEDALSWLHDRFSLGLITNGPSEFQRKKIEQLGISKYFDGIIVSGEFGEHKPNPKIFNFAVESLNSSVEDSVHIGDRPDSDIDGAQSVGITGILVRKEYPYKILSKVKPNFIIDKVTDLPELINIQTS
tara:strand:+ start:11964 stop:12668 length:705 start_codon:yes stop_codon:yes gene_type:complete